MKAYPPDRRGEFAAGAFTILPLLVAVAPFGLLLGTLAAQKGLSPLETALMGATVFAGASQFVAVEIWTTPPAVALLTATALMVNLRPVLMGAAMAQHVRGWSRGPTYGGLFFMDDETWAFAPLRAAARPMPQAPYFAPPLPP